MQEFTYKTTGVCSREMLFTMDGDVVSNLEIQGGCDGNLKGIISLIKGKHTSEVIESLEGITCGTRTTSCPDQIAHALRIHQTKENM